MLVSRQAKLGHEARFECLMAEFLAKADAYPGCLGTQLVHPGDEEDVDDKLYHALIAFENEACRQAWQSSPERAASLLEISPYIEGKAFVRGISGLAHWFLPTQLAKAEQPPRWKVAIATWLGIFPTVYLLFVLLGELLAPWPLIGRIFLLTILVVAIMTWGVAPRLTRLLKPWLYPSESNK
ncbi:antibiotic biosynthesis monooxygenase [Formivibrio citricus]